MIYRQYTTPKIGDKLTVLEYGDKKLYGYKATYAYCNIHRKGRSSKTCIIPITYFLPKTIRKTKYGRPTTVSPKGTVIDSMDWNGSLADAFMPLIGKPFTVSGIEMSCSPYPPVKGWFPLYTFDYINS